MAEKISKLTVLFATETGNSEDLAQRTVEKAEELGFQTEIINVSDYDAKDLASVECLVFVGSTWGEGEPPESAWDFQDALVDGDAIDCSKLKFAVLALGDHDYEQFCEFGKKIDQALEKHGGKRIYARKDCGADYEDEFDGWLEGLFNVIQPA